jgi:hypothetical protein
MPPPTAGAILPPVLPDAPARPLRRRRCKSRPYEAGHFLGALNEKGKYDSEYGHPEKSQEMLMYVHHIGNKIPYSAVTKFNYGYHR